MAVQLPKLYSIHYSLQTYSQTNKTD